VEPGPRLRALEAAVLAGDAEVDPATAPRSTAPLAVPVARKPGPTPGLPMPHTSLIGRQRELADVRRLLCDVRLVTLTGPGGCGKTRLAVSSAGQVAAEGRRVVLVDLTRVSDPELVADAVGTALGVAERPGTDRTQTILDAADPDVLIVLDNCEHNVQACAELVDRLLAGCPGMTILATSREALRVVGEAGYEVPPLSVPDPGVPRTLSELAVYDSVRLFLDRAADHGVREFNEDDAPAIAQLCAALDGLPLAIELAAARTRMLTPAEIVRRLRDRFGLLTMGPRTGPSHHRTLRATLAWSLDLLNEDEKALFARLGVFVGGFSVEAVEAVWQPDRALDVLTGLVAKSLVRVCRHGRASRFSLLETVAAYAVELLRAEPDAERQTRERHAEYFLAMSEDAGAEPTGARLRELGVEHDNLRAAMFWLAGEPDGAGELRLAVALCRYCHLHGHYREGRQWLERALSRVDNEPSGTLVGALAGAASLALFECDYPQAAAHATAGLRLGQALEDHRQIGRLHRLLGSVAREQARYGQALRSYTASGESFRAAGDPYGVAYAHQLSGATAWLAGELDAAGDQLTISLLRLRELDDLKGAASSLAYLGAVALYRGDAATARRLLDEALEVFSGQEFKEGIAWALNLLGLVEHAAGRDERAASLLQNSLALHRDLGDRWRQASVLEALATVACATGESDRAAWLLHEAKEIRTTIDAPVPTVERRALAST
jgi:predicted ATPase